MRCRCCQSNGVVPDFGLGLCRPCLNQRLAQALARIAHAPEDVVESVFVAELERFNLGHHATQALRQIVAEEQPGIPVSIH